MSLGISQQYLDQIIVDGNAATLVHQAEELGDALQQTGLTKSQIRSLYGTVRQIQANWQQDLPAVRLRKVLLLKPRLAYQGARELKVKPLAETLSSAIDLVASAKDTETQELRFGHFVDLFEAILAYHTAAGGRN